MEKATRTQKVKDHVKKHKGVYIAGTAGVAVGATAAIVFTKSNIQIVDSCKVTLFQWKSPTVNNVQLVRRGHPGYRIQCNETGESFASIRRTAEALGLNRSHIQEHLKGARESVNGFTFQNLGEATRVA